MKILFLLVIMLAMVRYKAIIAYDGTLFSGFQRQPQARSVQEELEKTLKLQD